jgi:guanylate cyclase
MSHADGRPAGWVIAPKSVPPPARLTGAWARLRDLATRSGDSRDERMLKRLQTTMALASIPAVGMWGLSFVAQGHPSVAWWHVEYVAVTVAMLALVGVTKRWESFRVAHPAVVMLLPFGLHWQLGGFRGSGGAILWCLLAPMAVMMFAGARRSQPFFAAIVLFVLVGLLRDGPFAPARYELSESDASFQFAFNTIGFVAFLYLSTRYFVTRLDEEKARSDRLLLNVLPAPIADRLKREEATIATRHESVSVLFCDLVGFTALASRLAPEAVVSLLDEIFTAFDAICDEHGVEKIKTIGDAYMLVAGAPRGCDDHAARAAHAALAMRTYLAQFARARRVDLSMRVGIHSGPVVAGVIGRRKFIYDLWGDTVNVASRMESHGAPDRVHVTEATRALLGTGFTFTERGAIPVKGKGEMRTYWLDGVAISSRP